MSHRGDDEFDEREVRDDRYVLELIARDVLYYVGLFITYRDGQKGGF